MADLNNSPNPEQIMRKIAELAQDNLQSGTESEIPQKISSLPSSEAKKYPWDKYLVHTPDDQQAKAYLDSEFIKLPEIAGKKFSHEEISDFNSFFGKSKQDKLFAEKKKQEIY